MSGRAPRRRPRPTPPAVPYSYSPTPTNNLRIPLTLPVRKHEPNAYERDKAEALARLPPVPDGPEPATPESIDQKHARQPEADDDTTPEKASDTTPSQNNTDSSEPLQCPASPLNPPVKRKILVPETCEQSDSQEPIPVVQRILVPDSCPTDEDESESNNNTNSAVEVKTLPKPNATVLVPETPNATQQTEQPLASIPLRIPLSAAMSQQSRGDGRPLSIPLRLPTQLSRRGTKPLSIPLKLPTQFSRRDKESLSIPLKLTLPSLRSNKPSSFDAESTCRPGSVILRLPIRRTSSQPSCTLRLPLSAAAASQKSNEKQVVVPETCEQSSEDDEDDANEFIPGTQFPTSTPSGVRRFLGADSSSEKEEDQSQFVPATLLVPETPNPSEQPPPSLTLRLPLTSSTHGRHSLPITAIYPASTPLSEKNFGTPSSRFIQGTPSSRTDSPSVDERRSFLIDADEVNQIRRDFGLSPASSLGPGQSLALDPQMVSYTKRVLQESAALASSPAPGSVGATAPVNDERSVSTSAARSVCPFTPKKSGAVSRLSSTPSSSPDNTNTVARERIIGESGASDEFYNASTPKTAKKITANANESELDTGRSSVHKRPRSLHIQGARQQLRFDLTPNKPLNLGIESEDEIGEPSRKAPRTDVDVPRQENWVLPAKREIVLSDDEKQQLESPLKQLRRDPGSTVRSPKAVKPPVRGAAACRAASENAGIVKSMFQTGVGKAVMFSEKKAKDVIEKLQNPEMEMTGFTTAKGKSIAVDKSVLARVQNQSANLVPPTGVGDARKQPRDSLESIVLKGTPAPRPPLALHPQLATPGVGALIAGSGVTTIAGSSSKAEGEHRPQIRQPIFTSAKRVAEQEGAIQFTTRRGQPIPTRRLSETGGELPADNLGDQGLCFTSGRGKPVPMPKFPEGGFTTGNGRNVTIPAFGGFTTGKGDAVPAPSFAGFSTGNGKQVETPFKNNGMITPDLDAIFANAKKLTAHKNFRQPLFSTGNGRTVQKSNFETPALQGGGRLLKTPGIGSGRANQPVARALPFNTASSPRRAGLSTEKGVTFRNLPLKTPRTNGLSSRRQLFQTPVKAARGRGGLKSTPFRRPRKVPPVHPHRTRNSASPSVKSTKDLDLFFPKNEVPFLSTCGKLVTSSVKYSTENVAILEAEISGPAEGVSFVFLKSRFGPWNVLPEEVRKFCKFDEISVFCVDDCVALLTHVFPAAEKKPATRVGSRDWTRMSYGLAVWKLARLEAEKGKAFLTVANLLREMWRRVDREWHKNQAPHLAQMLRRDASPRSHVVLMICSVNIDDGRKVMLEVTDGWYICRMRACQLLAKRVRSKHLNVGDKIHVFECELVSCNDEPFFFGYGDEMGANALAPSGNCVKKAREPSTSRLGIRKGPLFTRTLSGFRSDGGKCPGAQVIVLRSYPPFFIETTTGDDGESHSVFRKQEAEEAAQLEFANKLAARAADEEKEPNGDEIMERRNVSVAIDFTVCGVADDVCAAGNRKLIRIYRPSEDVVRLLSKEGSAVQLPPMKQSGRNWVTLSPVVRPVKVSNDYHVRQDARCARRVQALAGHEVPDGADFDGVYVSVYVTEPTATGARFAYMVDECCAEEKRFLVVEMRGTDATCMPRALSKGMYNSVAVRDLELSGVDARLGVVHARVTLRTQMLSVASTRKRRLTYLVDRADELQQFVTSNRTKLDQVRDAVVAFASGDSSQIRVG